MISHAFTSSKETWKTGSRATGSVAHLEWEKALPFEQKLDQQSHSRCAEMLSGLKPWPETLTKYIRSVPTDITKGLQDISNNQLLSWTKFKATLFAATTEELELARERQEILDQMLECLEMMGYAGKLHRLVRTLLKGPGLQALLICAALTMEQNGFSLNLEEISIAVRTNLPIFKRMQEVRTTLQQELPALAKEIPALPDLGKLLHGTQQQRDNYFTHLQEVYQQNKEVLDAFWARHPALKED